MILRCTPEYSLYRIQAIKKQSFKKLVQSLRHIDRNLRKPFLSDDKRIKELTTLKIALDQNREFRNHETVVELSVYSAVQALQYSTNEDVLKAAGEILTYFPKNEYAKNSFHRITLLRNNFSDEQESNAKSKFLSHLYKEIYPTT